MKKLIIVLFLTALMPFAAKAQPYGNFKDVTVDITARGGYNFMEKSPNVGAAVGLQFYGVRADLEVGWTYFHSPNTSGKENFCYVSPMIGYSYGFNHTVYAMVGITNWACAELINDSQQYDLKKNIICGKVKVGCNLFVTQNMFINLDLSYILPRRTGYHCINNQGLNLSAGIGFSF